MPQWRGHDLISDLRPVNKKILDIHVVHGLTVHGTVQIVHGLTPHAKHQNHRSKTVGPSDGPILTCITSIDFIWRPDLTRYWLENQIGHKKDTGKKL